MTNNVKDWPNDHSCSNHWLRSPQGYLVFAEWEGPTGEWLPHDQPNHMIETEEMILQGYTYQAPCYTPDQVDHMVAQANINLLCNLIKESYPADKVLFKSVSGASLTAEQMIVEIQNRTPLGQEYGSDLLRVARDLLSRQALRD